MRIVRQVAFISLFLLGLAASRAVHSQPAEGDAAAIQASTSDKSPGAALIAGDEGSWSLVSDGKDSRVVARIGWQSLSGKLAFGFESSASIQEGSPETDLLNLEGLAGGDTSVAGQVSFRGFRSRGPERLRGVCDEINLEIEKQIRSDRGAPLAKPLHGGTCTVKALQDLGWAVEAEKAELDALTWACGELAKLNPEIVLTLKNAPLKCEGQPVERFGKTGDCTPDEFAEKANVEKARRKGSPDFVKAQGDVATAKVDRGKLIEEIADTEAAFAAATDPTERRRLAAKRLELAEFVAKQDGIIAENEGKLKAMLPDLLTTKEVEVGGKKKLISVALEKKTAELLAALCKRFNEPDRSAELVLGRERVRQDCVLGRIETSIAALQDARLRNQLRHDVIVNLPAAVWAVTVRGGLDNKGFKFVEPNALPGFTTFEQLENGVQSETEHDSLFGVDWTLQSGANFWHLGYERKNVHKGGDATDACVPAAAGSSVQRCTNVVLGKPKRVEENVATIEYRRLLTSRLGLSARALFLDETVRNNKPVSDEWEGHLVLYFLTHATKGLNGGIDVAYDSLTKEPVARLFIGQSFNLFE